MSLSKPQRLRLFDSNKAKTLVRLWIGGPYFIPEEVVEQIQLGLGGKYVEDFTKRYFNDSHHESHKASCDRHGCQCYFMFLNATSPEAAQAILHAWDDRLLLKDVTVQYAKERKPAAEPPCPEDNQAGGGPYSCPTSPALEDERPPLPRNNKRKAEPLPTPEGVQEEKEEEAAAEEAEKEEEEATAMVQVVEEAATAGKKAGTKRRRVQIEMVYLIIPSMPRDAFQNQEHIKEWVAKLHGVERCVYKCQRIPVLGQRDFQDLRVLVPRDVANKLLALNGMELKLASKTKPGIEYSVNMTVTYEKTEQRRIVQEVEVAGPQPLEDAHVDARDGDGDEEPQAPGTPEPGAADPDAAPPTDTSSTAPTAEALPTGSGAAEGDAGEIDEEPLPPGWEKATCEETGKPYFYRCRSDGSAETTWDRPEVAEAEVEVAGPQPLEGAPVDVPAPSDAGGSDEDPLIPAGWVRTTCLISGRPQYRPAGSDHPTGAAPMEVDPDNL